jgi:hypothetical protein
MNNQILYGRRRGPVGLPAAPPPRDRASKLESYRPLALCPQNWAVLLRDETPVGSVLDFGQG